MAARNAVAANETLSQREQRRPDRRLDEELQGTVPSQWSAQDNPLRRWPASQSGYRMSGARSGNANTGHSERFALRGRDSAATRDSWTKNRMGVNWP